MKKSIKDNPIFLILCGVLLLAAGIYLFSANASYYVFGNTYNMHDLLFSYQEWPVDRFTTFTVDTCFGNYAETKHTVNGLIPIGKDEHYIVMLEDHSLVSVSVKGKKHIQAMEKLTEETWNSEEYRSDSPITLTGMIKTGVDPEVQGYYQEVLSQMGIDPATSEQVRYMAIDTTDTRIGGWMIFLGALILGGFCLFSGISGLRQKKGSSIPGTADTTAAATAVDSDRELDAWMNDNQNPDAWMNGGTDRQE